ncbi:MAG: hemolysin [Pseudomonadota bacterium]|nr:hemolysin [Pseudomonadota bacterium]
MKSLIFILAASGLLAASCAPVEDGGPVPPSDSPNQCRADRYQRYIGRNRTELPPRPANESWRVTCTTCPVTFDYSPARLNILFDEATGVIREVNCG